MLKNKKTIIYLLVGLVIIFSFFLIKGKLSKPVNSSATVPQVTVQSGDVTQIVSATGTVQATTIEPRPINK